MKNVTNEMVYTALDNCTATQKCRNCPWEDCEEFDCERVNVPKSLLLDCMDIIKDTYPRLIDFDEIDNYEVLWLEVRDVDDETGLAPWVKTNSGKWYSPLICGESMHDIRLIKREHYNVIGRCWTQRPTDKQRNTAEWNE